MNLLVAVGLLVLGVLFLVALVFVLRSEPTKKESVSETPPISTAQEEPKKTYNLADEPASTVETRFTPDVGTVPVAEKQAVNERYPLAHGQFYELVNELRSMRTQTQELEHRLDTLIDMAQRVEQAQNGRFPIEEQDESPTDILSARQFPKT